MSQTQRLDVVNFLEEEGISRVEWPGNSPDLNPFENLWANMKRRHQHIDTSSREKVIDEVTKIWKKLEISELDTLASSMPTMIQECIRRKGGSTKY